MKIISLSHNRDKINASHLVSKIEIERILSQERDKKLMQINVAFLQMVAKHECNLCWQNLCNLQQSRELFLSLPLKKKKNVY
jgi:hypothetical protein